MSAKYPVRSLIRTALIELFGDCYVPTPYASRLKNGTRIYRISGAREWGEGALFKKDGKIFLRMRAKYAHGELKEVTRKMLDEVHDDWPHYFQWVWHVLDLGSERVEEHLRNALVEAGYNVEVRVGRAIEAGTCYPTSIAVEIKRSPQQSRDAVLDLLIRQLPQPGSFWSVAERVRWLRSAAAMLDLMYGPAAVIGITEEEIEL